VVDAVRNIFVEGALGDQGAELDQAEKAIKAELDLATQQVRTKELEIARFKQANLGYMPDQATDYYARLQSAQAELSQTRRLRELAEIRRDELRRQIAGEEPVIGLMP